MQNYLNELQNCKSLKSLKDCIENHFLVQANGNYMPAILSYQCNKSTENNCYFYAKLTVIPKIKKDKQFWLKEYLEESIPVQVKNVEEASCHNLITQINFKGKKIFAVNRHLTTVNTVHMTNDIQNNILLEYYKNSTMPLLHSTANGNSIFINKSFVEDILENIFKKEYTLSLDFYIRSNQLQLKKENTKNCRIETTKECVQLYGNCILDESCLKKESHNKDAKLYVYNVLEKNFTQLCRYPLQTKADTGILFFSMQILPFLKANFYNYGLYLVHKQSREIILVDILENIIAFWKSEFLKLSDIEQKEFEQYNQVICPENFISQAMYMWQIEGRVNYADYMPIYQSFAEYLLQNYKEKLIEQEITFFPPNSVLELKEFIEKLLNFADVVLDDLKLKEEQRDIFIQILQNRKVENLDIFKYYNGFCYIMHRRMKDGTIRL